MSEMIDLGPATEELKALLRHVRDDHLGAPTPCSGHTLGDLVDHIGGMAVAFAAAAAKDLGPKTANAPEPDASNLDARWRSEIPARLDDLAEAWSRPEAWEGTTQVGGVTLPGAAAGTVALHELVLHGWDLAKATGQPYALDESTTKASLDSLMAMYPRGEDEAREGIFGPPVDVPDDAPPLDRAVAHSGRDPHWAA